MEESLGLLEDYFEKLLEKFLNEFLKKIFKWIAVETLGGILKGIIRWVSDEILEIIFCIIPEKLLEGIYGKMHRKVLEEKNNSLRNSRTTVGKAPGGWPGELLD